MEKEQIINTNGIPQCPHCKKPTKRAEGLSTSTAMYYPAIYDESGNNTNPDRNINTTSWQCLECNKHYSVSGNYSDGYYYNK